MPDQRASMKRIAARSWLLTLVLSLAGLPAPAGNPPEQALKVPLSRPAEPVKVVASATWGGIHVEGYDGQEVGLWPEKEEADEGGTPVGGLRSIPNPSFDVTAEEENNEVHVRADGQDFRRLRLWVPRQASLSLTTVNGGEISVEGVHGELELTNADGEIVARRVQGSVVAHTANGGIVVDLERVAPGLPMSFSTLHGDVDVTLPASTKADLVIKSTHGEIYTDFDVRWKSQPPQVDEKRVGGRYELKFEKDVRGSINGGGPELRFQTFEGDVYLRTRR